MRSKADLAMELNDYQRSFINKHINPQMQIFRKTAIENFAGLEFPNQKKQSWENTNIDALHWEQYEINLQHDKVMREQPLNYQTHDEYSAVVNIRGNTFEIIHDEKIMNAGVVIKDWFSSLYDSHEYCINNVGKLITSDSDKLAALTHSYSNIGVFIFIPQNVIIEKPLYIKTHFYNQGNIYPYYTMLYIAQGASVDIIQQYVSNHHNNIFSGVTEIFLEENANLNLLEIQRFGKKMWNFDNQKVQLAKNSRLNWFQLELGGSMLKKDICVEMAGKYSEVLHTNIYMPKYSQNFSINTWQDHLSPFTKSDMLLRGVNYNQSSSAWRGMIHVGKDAIETDAYQASNNLLMDSSIKVNAIPSLEILTDEVRCSHGVTMSEIDDEQLFYLYSRGIEDRIAKQLIVNGYLESALERNSNPIFKRFLRKVLKI